MYLVEMEQIVPVYLNPNEVIGGACGKILRENSSLTSARDCRTHEAVRSIV